MDRLLRYTTASSMTDYQGLALASVLSISLKGIIAMALLPLVQIKELTGRVPPTEVQFWLRPGFAGSQGG